MPRKIRDLRADLRKAGYRPIKGGGKGSHTKMRHPLIPGSVTIAGHDGDDTKPYQEQDVADAIQKAREAEQRQKGNQP